MSVSRHCTCLFWFREFPSTFLNESVRAESNSLTQLDAVCQKQWRVMACLGEGELIVQRAASNRGLYHHHHVGLCEPMRKSWGWFHSLIHHDIHSPSSLLLQGRDAAPIAPSPTLRRSVRQMSVYALSYTMTLMYFTQSCHSVAMDSDSDLCGSYMTLKRNAYSLLWQFLPLCICLIL